MKLQTYVKDSLRMSREDLVKNLTTIRARRRQGKQKVEKSKSKPKMVEEDDSA